MHREGGRRVGDHVSDPEEIARTLVCNGFPKQPMSAVTAEEVVDLCDRHKQHELGYLAALDCWHRFANEIGGPSVCVERPSPALARIWLRGRYTPVAVGVTQSERALAAALMELTEYYAFEGCDGDNECECEIHQMWHRVNEALLAAIPALPKETT